MRAEGWQVRLRARGRLSPQLIFKISCHAQPPSSCGNTSPEAMRGQGSRWVFRLNPYTACFHKVCTSVLYGLPFPSRNLPPTLIILHPTGLTGEAREAIYSMYFFISPSTFPTASKSQRPRTPNAAQVALAVTPLSQKPQPHGGGCWVTKAQPWGPVVQLMVAVVHPH